MPLRVRGGFSAIVRPMSYGPGDAVDLAQVWACGNDGCGGGKVSECLRSIPVQAVLDAVAELLPR